MVALNWKRFFDRYHPFLPFLDPLKSPDDYQDMSPCLFWAIISAASRRYLDDVTLLTVLSSYVSTLIWAEISQPPYTVATVQAIIILCTWPFPTTSTWNEPAVTLSSVAINIAMQVGLHRPVNAQDFLSKQLLVCWTSFVVDIVQERRRQLMNQRLAFALAHGQLQIWPRNCKLQYE